MTKELWRWAVGYEGVYMVSNMGSVMGVPRCSPRTFSSTYQLPGQAIALHDNGRGYKIVGLYRDGSSNMRLVHRLVAEAFIENHHAKPDVNHIDGNKANNRVENLEWCTKSENSQHASLVLHALDFNRIFSEEDVSAIRNDQRSQYEIARDYGVTQSTVSCIKRGQTYKSVDAPTDARGCYSCRKLSLDQIKRIREGNETGRLLAKEMKVSPSTISKIRSNQRYKEMA